MASRITWKGALLAVHNVLIVSITCLCDVQCSVAQWGEVGWAAAPVSALMKFGGANDPPSTRFWGIVVVPRVF